MATLHYGIRKDTVTPGGYCWIFWPKGLNSYAPGVYDWRVPTLRAGWRWDFPANFVNGTINTTEWAWQLYVPTTEVPGTYEIETGVPSESVFVTVVAAPAVRPVRYVNTPNWSTLQGWLYEGYDLVLTSRTYYTNGLRLIIPDGAKITAAGVTIVHSANALTVNHLFNPLGSFKLYGGTLTHDDTIGTGECSYIYSVPAPAGNLDIQDVNVRRGALISSWHENVESTNGGSILKGIEFHGGVLGSMPFNSFMSQCLWEGQAENFFNHGFASDGGHESLITSSYWRNMSRDMVFQGQVYGCMLIDLHMDNTHCPVTNAGECILFEDGIPGTPAVNPSMRDITILNTRITQSSGPGITFQGDHFSGMIVLGCDIETEKHAISILSLNDPLGVGGGGMVSGWRFDNNQIRGAVVLSGKAGNHNWENLQVIKGPPGRGNFGPFATGYEINRDEWPIQLIDMGWGVDDAQVFSTCQAIDGDVVVPLTNCYPFKVTTTGDTVTTLFTALLREGFAYTITAHIQGVSGTTFGDFGIRVKAYRATAGTATLVNVTSLTVDDDPPAGWGGLTAEASGNNILFKVTGAAATNIKWRKTKLEMNDAAL